MGVWRLLAAARATVRREGRQHRNATLSSAGNPWRPYTLDFPTCKAVGAITWSVLLKPRLHCNRSSWLPRQEVRRFWNWSGFSGTSTVFTPEACSVHNAPDTVLLGLPLSWAATMMPFARTRVGHNEAFGKRKPCWLGRLLSCATHGRGIHAARRHSRAHSRPLHHQFALEIVAWVNSLVHHLRNEALRWFWSDTTHTAPVARNRQ